MNIGTLFNSVITNVSFWGAIVATILIISLGWVIVKVKWFKIEWKDALITIVMKITYPALILKSFMNTTYLNDFKMYVIVLGLSIGFYTIGCLLYFFWTKWLLPKLVNKNRSLLSEDLIADKYNKNLNMWMMCIFGSTVFFGTPIISSLFGASGLLAQALWVTPYTIGLVSFCQFQYLDIKFKKSDQKKIIKIFLSPLMICTFLGIIFWFTQLIPGSLIKIDQISYLNVNDIPENLIEKGVWWFDLKYTAPFLYKSIDFLQCLTSPLIWITIGATIATKNLKTAIFDKDAWVYSLIKLMFIPAMMMFIVSGIGKINNCFYFTMNSDGNFIDGQINVIVIITILMATPPASICVAYAITTNKKPNFAANASIISTFLTPIMIPFWIVISTLFTNHLNLIGII